MKRNIFLIVLMLSLIQIISAKTIFTIEGPEKSYNQIRLVNETSQDTIRCRLIVLDSKDEYESVYGIYNCNGKHDSDSNSHSIQRGKRIAIEMAKDFPNEISITLDYIDLPFYDVVRVYIYDKFEFK